MLEYMNNSFPEYVGPGNTFENAFDSNQELGQLFMPYEMSSWIQNGQFRFPDPPWAFSKGSEQ